jgi:hypothetical protein
VRGWLRDLIGWRADLAREIECFASCCACDRDSRRAQVILDAALDLVDRAVDTLALGNGYPPNNTNIEEWRASASAFLALNYQNDPRIQQIQPLMDLANPAIDPRPWNVVNGLVAPAAAQANAILQDTAQELGRRELEFSQLVVSLAPRCAMFA